LSFVTPLRKLSKRPSAQVDETERRKQADRDAT
jgi:hypothetical protein